VSKLKPIKVRPTKLGFYNHKRRYPDRENNEFLIRCEADFSNNWMEKVGKNDVTKVAESNDTRKAVAFSRGTQSDKIPTPGREEEDFEGGEKEFDDQDFDGVDVEGDDALGEGDGPVEGEAFSMSMVNTLKEMVAELKSLEVEITGKENKTELLELLKEAGVQVE